MANFKLFLALAACLSGQALAAPTKTIAKRATVSDVSLLTIPNISSSSAVFNPSTQVAHGYASQNGGTSGGAGGTTTTVSSYAQFTEAVSSDDAKIVIVDGTISKAADQVKVGSNTSIIGKDANAILEGFGLYVFNRSTLTERETPTNTVLVSSRRRRTSSSVTWVSRRSSPITVMPLVSVCFFFLAHICHKM